MQNKIVIDGYNLIRTDSQLEGVFNRDIESARNKLLDLLNSYKMSKKVEIIVVFDSKLLGIDSGGISRGITVRFVPDADRYIKNFVAGEEKPGIIEVVSSDRDLIGFVKSKGAKTISSSDFMHRLRRKSPHSPLFPNPQGGLGGIGGDLEPKKPETESSEMIDYWLTEMQKKQPNPNE